MWKRMSGVTVAGKNYAVCTMARGVGKFATMLFATNRDGEVKDWTRGAILEEFGGERSAELGHERIVRDTERIGKAASTI